MIKPINCFYYMKRVKICIHSSKPLFSNTGCTLKGSKKCKYKRKRHDN